MSSLNQSLVYVGLTPNDGTGSNLREAFVTYNQNVENLTSFTSSPTYNTATIYLLDASTLTSNIGIFNTNLTVLSSTLSTSPSTGALHVVGGTGIGGNLYVGGTINGTIHGNSGVFGTVTSTGDGLIGGNLSVAGEITAGSLLVNSNVAINGSLTVFGNVTTITSSELVIEDTAIAVGAPPIGMSLSTNDGKDRGVDFYWYDTVGNVQRMGFFGFDNTPSLEFAYTPDKVTGNLGNARFNTITANVVSLDTSNFNHIVANTIVSNIITASTGFTGNLLTASQPNVTSLGTLSNLGVASGNVQVTSGSIYVTGGTVYIDGQPVAIASQNFTGGTVANPTLFASGVASTNTTSGAVVVTGGLGVGGNLNVGGSLSTTTFSATLLAGTLTTADQPNITSVGTLGNLVVANSINANTMSLSSIVASNSINASTLTATVGITGLLTSGTQTNITSVGTLTDLSVTGNIIATKFTGLVTGDVTGNVTGSAATVTTGPQPAITSVGTLGNLNVTGATSVGSLDAGAGLIQTTGNITASGNVSGLNVFGTVRTAAQPNITSLGNLNGLVVNGTSVVIGNATFASAILATGAGSQAIGSATNRFGSLYSSTINNSGVTTSGSFSGPLNGSVGGTTPSTGAFTTVSTTGNVTIGTGFGLRFADGTYQSTASFLTSIATSGVGITVNAATGNVTITSNATALNTANTIVARDADGSFAANVVVAVSTAAQYADLAEMYRSDGQYDPATVVIFGGAYEVTTTGHFADTAVAGVVSTAPGYLMNSEETHGIPIALRGKVPTKVMGPVRKGDLLVTSATPGYAESVGKDVKYGAAVFAKSLDENLTAGPKIINAVIL